MLSYPALSSASEKRQLGLLADVVNKSKVNFSYELLEKATGYFHQSSKLGQGGSGSVYKVSVPHFLFKVGTLPIMLMDKFLFLCIGNFA